MSRTMWTIPPFLLTSYYYNYSPFGCDDTRVHGYIFFLGRRASWLGPLCFWLWAGMRGVNVGLYWCGDNHRL